MAKAGAAKQRSVNPNGGAGAGARRAARMYARRPRGLTGKDYIYRSFMANGNRADTTMTPAKTFTKQTGWPPLPMTAKRTIAAKILPAWTRRFGSIALLDFIPRIRVVIRSKDLHVLCYSRAFRVSSVSSRVKGPGCDRSRSREKKETRRLALAAVATTRSSLTASV
jgi:hypothetical protein